MLFRFALQSATCQNTKLLGIVSGKRWNFSQIIVKNVSEMQPLSAVSKL